MEPLSPPPLSLSLFLSHASIHLNRPPSLIPLMHTASLTPLRLCVRPTRWDCVLDVTEQFIHSFFDQNPISHLALAVMRDGKTDALSSLSGNKSKHVGDAGDGYGQLALEHSRVVHISRCLNAAPVYATAIWFTATTAVLSSSLFLSLSLLPLFSTTPPAGANQ